jgi:hypothetical protein
MVRDQTLFWPWFDHSRAGVLRGTPQVDPAQIDARVLELFASSGLWRRSLLAGLKWPMTAKLAKLRVPAAITTSPADPWSDCAERAATALPRLVRVALPDEQMGWASALLPWFDGR